MYGLCLPFLLGGCRSPFVVFTGVHGPVAWEVTDFRIVEQAVDGSPRALYAFTLVLRETQGLALQFTSVEHTLSHTLLSHAGTVYHEAVGWQLRPRGELRQPVSFAWCTDARCQQASAQAPWYYSMVLHGSDARARPLQLTIDFQLPQHPRGLQSPSFQTAQNAAATSADAPTALRAQAVPFETIHNHLLVRVVLNQRDTVTMVLDTGASHTFVTPATARRLGLSPTARTPRLTTRIVGGRELHLPFVRLATMAVGHAALENVLVGVTDFLPDAPLLDGILGENFLASFTMTLDYTHSRLWLTARNAARPLPAPSRPGSRSILPVQMGKGPILVRALVNRREPVMLLLDTGATHTILTPKAAQRAGITPTAAAPTLTLIRADGQHQAVPFVQVPTLTVGEAAVRNLSVGITTVLPHIPGVDGLLGVDFLAQFTVTLERTKGELWLDRS